LVVSKQGKLAMYLTVYQTFWNASPEPVKKDYVMIEVPIPASCSYDEKRGRGPYEVHREYFRHKVTIFADRLPKGKYSYTIQLLPRFNGQYTVNPAKAELMYFPVFYGRTGIKSVTVR
jgi:alpha-2-macroglobulin